MSRTRILSACLGLLCLAGCTQPETHLRRSSLLDYLYPKATEAPAPNPSGARLHLPLKLGIAFVPAPAIGRRLSRPILPGEEKPLLDLVKRSFQGRPWIGQIKLIPSAYLRPRGGFDNLDQVARMYGVEVMALVSVDQIQYTDPKWYSFTYLSIVGAYVLPGDANDTRTLIDAAVYDVPTRTFLLRAPGQSEVKGSSTWIHREVQLREHAQKGLELAMGDLSKNLDAEVAAFKAEVASGERKDVDVVDRKGVSLRESGGRNFGGALGWPTALGALVLLALGLKLRRA